MYIYFKVNQSTGQLRLIEIVKSILLILFLTKQYRIKNILISQYFVGLGNISLLTICELLYITVRIYH